MLVRVRGRVYESAHAAAAAFGVTVDTIYDAVARRDPETVGFGRGYRPPGSRKGGRPPKPCKIGHVEFPSMAAASRALGMNRTYLRNALSGGERARAGVVAAMMAFVAKMEKQAQRERAGD